MPPPVAQSVEPLLRQHSQELARSASRLFIGRAASFALSEGSTPLQRRQSTLRDVGQAQADVAGRVREEILQSIFTRLRVLIPMMFIIIFVMFVYTIVWIGALVAWLKFQFAPCDQPLQYYFPGSLLAYWVISSLHKRLASACTPRGQDLTDPSFSGTVKKQLMVLLAVYLLYFACYGYGVYMVNQCQTCSETNPGLFYPTRLLVYCQIFTTLTFTISSVVATYGLTNVMLPLLARFNATPGCESAVKALPRVPAGDTSLFDEDGEPSACPICMESFPQGAIKTPCDHLFHEDCLATWCKNHVDCPLCRQPVGEQDLEVGGA